MRTGLLLAAAIAVFSLPLAPAGIRSAGADPQSETRSTKVGVCLRAQPTRLPGFSSSGSWLEGGTELALLDNVGRTILRYSFDGEALGEVSPAVRPYLERSFPTQMSAFKDGLVLQVNGNRLDVLDRSFRPQRIQLTNAASGSESPLVDKIFQWTLVPRERSAEVVAIADVKQGENSWWSGLVRFPLSNPSAVELIQPIDDEERVFYRITYPFLATAAKAAYILRMDNQMGLYRVELDENGKGQLKQLRSFEAIYPHPSLSPQLPLFRQPEDFSVIMLRVERSRMPAGLFGWNGYLYVLSREFHGRTTQWSLSKIDPETDRFLGTAHLSSVQANHLTLVPGPQRWAALEKAPVRGLAIQPVRNLFLIPASRFGERSLKGDPCQP